MPISKQLNQFKVNMFLQNKYITGHNIVVGYGPTNASSKKYEDLYEYGSINTNISTEKDLEIFMKDFLNSPLKNLDIIINHQLKSSMRGTGFTVVDITVNGIQTYELRY